MIDLKRLRSGDRNYRAYLVRTYGPLVMGVCKDFGRDYDHTQDLYQECWVRVFRRQGSYRGDGSFETWLHRVATRVCISDFRRRKAYQRAHERVRQENTVDDPGLKEVDPIAEKEKREARRKLDLALYRLPGRECEALTLRVLENIKPSEVARIMGIEASTVRSMIRHSIKRLRKLMEV